MAKEIKIAYKLPGKAPTHISVPNTLEALQQLVGGYIEVVRIFSDLVVICNEEGRIKGLEHNCVFADYDFCGPLIFCGTQGEHFADLPGYQRFRTVFGYLYDEQNDKEAL